MCIVTAHAQLRRDYAALTQAHDALTQKNIEIEANMRILSGDLVQSGKMIAEFNKEVDYLNARIADLESLPTIEPCGTISIDLYSSILLDKLEEMGCEAEIYLPDSVMKIYNKQEVIDFLGLDEISAIRFVAETMDCDDFAAKLFSKFAGLVWSNLHALGFFIDENETFWFVEPQNDKILQRLEGWQGNDIRFLIGR